MLSKCTLLLANKLSTYLYIQSVCYSRGFAVSFIWCSDSHCSTASDGMEYVFTTHHR